MPAPIPLTITAFSDAASGLTGVALGETLAVWREAEPALTTSAIGTDTAALAGPQVELHISSLGEPSAPAPSGAGEQACRVHGMVDGGEGQLAVDASGVQVRLLLPGTRFGVLHFVAAWLGAERSLSLAAVRPARARGHDRDVISAWQRESDQVTLVTDPRLSITTLDDGTPLRVGVELWIETEDGETEYPWRVAGEVTGTGTALPGQMLRANAHPVRWRSPAGERGGVLLVARPG